jgi:hypothetical protein
MIICLKKFSIKNIKINKKCLMSLIKYRMIINLIKAIVVVLMIVNHNGALRSAVMVVLFSMWSNFQLVNKLYRIH